jgi:NADH:ubiquinone oxidoreductase subunit K
MGRAVGFIALVVLFCVVLGLVLHRVVIPMLIGAGILLLAIFVALGRAGSPGPEP